MMLPSSMVSLLRLIFLCLPILYVSFFIIPPTPTPTPTPTHFSPLPINVVQNKNNTTLLSPLASTELEVQSKSRNRVVMDSSMPPSTPYAEVDDEDDDEQVFELASRVNPNPKLPGGPKKLAFMFLTTTPLPFASLWELFFNNKTSKSLYNIYIHANPRFHYSPPFQGVFAQRLIPSKPTQRHTPTLVSAARRLLARALLDDQNNYMFALLSSSCIPLHSFKFTYNTLMKSEKSFIEILMNQPGIRDRWAARGDHVMLPEVKFEDFRVGSQFFVLKRSHARLVVGDKRLWAKFKAPCLTANICYPEEQYFPTLLSMMDPRGCIPATLTHVDWRGRHGGHPRTYDASEVGPKLIWTLRSDRPRYGHDVKDRFGSSFSKRHDPFLFARKFSPNSLGPLMRMANEVIFRD